MLFRWIFKQGPHLALGHTLDMPELQLPAKKMEQIHSNKCLHVQLYFGFYFGTKLFPVCQTLVWFEASLLKPPSGQSGRAGASWSMDSGSDDSHRWSDTLSIDEKDGFVFVNYSEGQTKGPHPHLAPQAQSSGPHSLHSASVEARTYNQLRAGLCPCTLHLLCERFIQHYKLLLCKQQCVCMCVRVCVHRLQMGASAGLPQQTHHAHSVWPERQRPPRWDQLPRHLQVWDQHHTLANAFRYTTVMSVITKPVSQS